MREKNEMMDARAMTTLPYERIDSEALYRAIRLFDGEHLLTLQPFGWHLDGKHIPNAAEQFSMESVCEEHNWEIVVGFGGYVAIVRQASSARPRTGQADVSSGVHAETYQALATAHADLLEAHASLVQEMETAKAEAAKYLSPHNENVKCGYLVAMIRDLAQIKVTAQGNAEDAMRLLKGRDEQIRMLLLEVKAAAAGAPAQGSLRTMLLDWHERLLALLRRSAAPGTTEERRSAGSI